MAGAELYLRTFWWFLVGIPLFGLLAVLWGPTPILRYIGAVCMLWPFTIYARAGLISGHLGRQLMRDTEVEVSDEAIVFETPGSERKARTGFRYRFLRFVWLRRDCYVLFTKKLGYSMIPVEAFTPENRADFENLLREKDLFRGPGSVNDDGIQSPPKAQAKEP